MHVISVHLTGVHLTGVYLTGVRLIGVQLTGVLLTGYASLIADVIHSRSYLSRVVPQIFEMA